jgi:hypothetical protein
MANKYILFGPEATAKLRAKLNEVGEGAQIKLDLPGTNISSKMKALLGVIDAQGKNHDPVNDSHVCPGSPGCP